MEEEKDVEVCSQCGHELGESYWTCWGSCQFSKENMVCGEGECWADWIQENMYEYNTSNNSQV